MRRLLIIAAVVLLALWGRTALYSVDAGEFAYVTRFGAPIATLDGRTDAGLHAKLPWPIDSVQRLDRRVQTFDLPAVESLTRDPLSRTVDKTLAVDAFVTWKIPDAAAVDRFVRTVGTPEQARKVLGPRINGRLAAVISTLPLDELVSVTDSATGIASVAGPAAVVGVNDRFDAENLRLIDERADRIRRRLLGEEGTDGGEASPADRLKERVLADYGIEIVQIRLRRFGYPEAVRASIAERIRSERARKVADYESDGRRRASDIATDADREARSTEAKAKEQKKLIEERAKKEAFDVLNAAHAQDREFYVFLETLKAYQTMLAETRDVLLLSTRHPLFDLLLKPPMAANGDKTGIATKKHEETQKGKEETNVSKP